MQYATVTQLPDPLPLPVPGDAEAWRAFTDAEAARRGLPPQDVP